MQYVFAKAVCARGLRRLRGVAPALLVGLVLAAPALASAQPGLQLLPQPAQGMGDGITWSLTPGVSSTQVLGMRCSLEPEGDGHAAGPGSVEGATSCIGNLIFALDVDRRLVFSGASTQGQACTVEPYYVACPVDIPDGQTQAFSLVLNPDPYLRNADPLYISARGNFRMNPLVVALQVRPQARLSLSQASAAVVPGVKGTGWTRLSLCNSGPSGMRNVTVTETLPQFLSASADESVCSFDDENSTLTCSWPTLDPGASISLPLLIEAAEGYPTSQVSASLCAQGDIGRAATASASIVVTGNPVVGLQNLDTTGDVTMFTSFVDSVSIHSVPGIPRDDPEPGIPVSWALQVPPGLHVLSIDVRQDSTQMTCTYSDDTVRCIAPSFGSGEFGTNANADITLRADQAGQQSLDLSWQSTQGSGRGTQPVNVIWDQAGPGR